MANPHLDLTMSELEEKRVLIRLRDEISYLQTLTHFSPKELERLVLIHYKITLRGPMNQQNFTDFMYQTFGLCDTDLLNETYRELCDVRRGAMTREEWVLAMSVMLRGTLDERIKMCFGVYDSMSTGFLTKDMITRRLGEGLISRPGDGGEADETMIEMVEMVLKKMDLDRDGKVSFDDYVAAVRSNPKLLQLLGRVLPERARLYTFMSTFCRNVTTHHKSYFKMAPVNMSYKGDVWKKTKKDSS